MEFNDYLKHQTAKYMERTLAIVFLSIIGFLLIYAFGFMNGWKARNKSFKEQYKKYLPESALPILFVCCLFLSCNTMKVRSGVIYQYKCPDGKIRKATKLIKDCECDPSKIDTIILIRHIPTERQWLKKHKP